LTNNTASGAPLNKSRWVSRLSRIFRASSEAITSNLTAPVAERGQRIYFATDWVISISLVLYALFAPHSIAITQSSYLIGLTAWGVQLVAARRLPFKRSPVDIALFGFFACCVVSSFLSYDLLVSVKGLKSPAFFLAFYFVSNKVRSLRFASFLGLALIVSCLVNVGYSAFTLGVGRGLRIDSIAPESLFNYETVKVGDVILEADDRVVNSQQDLVRIVESQRGHLRLKLGRKEAIDEVSIPRQSIKEARGTGFDRLGITTSPGRNFRVMGFYSHYETYAEVLQLIAALAVGMLISVPNKRSGVAMLLSAAIPLLTVTLILTSTRAALAGFGVAVFVMALASSRRRVLGFAIASIMVVFPLALLAVEHARGISVFDPDEGSTAYRLEVWREAFGIIKDNPLVGIGKGSEAKLKRSLGLYDEGRLPPGHFHSTPVQVAVWWGLLGLIFYSGLMTIIVVETWRLIKRVKSEGRWQLSGVALGGLGAVLAFNVSSLAHFNFGDGEVVMVFWLLTGLVFAIRRMAYEPRDETQDGARSAGELSSAESSRRSQLQGQAAVSGSSVRAARAKQN
jgi:O-antigen ligase/polysaccharide polymerase Wzy-like membrane protein